MSILLTSTGVVLLAIAAIGWGLHGSAEVLTQVAPQGSMPELRASLKLISDAKLIWAWALLLSITALFWSRELHIVLSLTGLLIGVFAYCFACSLVGATCAYLKAHRDGVVKTPLRSDLLTGIKLALIRLSAGALAIVLINLWASIGSR